MTSETTGTFVFVQLPGTTQPVVCGRYELDLRGPVGRFRYGRSYLENPAAFGLDPVNLPLSDAEYRTPLNHGLFGALRDSAPDAWGRAIIEHSASIGNELDYLLATSDTRVGALSFGPTPEPPALDFRGAVPLERLVDAGRTADAFEAEKDGIGAAEPLDPRLLDPSSGIGGARPKTIVSDQAGQLWVAKFPSRRDRWVNAVVEAAFLRLAGECGIQVPESRVVSLEGLDILLVKRFDQAPGAGRPIRHAFLSAHSLLGLDDFVTDRMGWSYLDLAHLIRRVSVAPDDDASELFRRAVFNAVTSNSDDHPRNHAILHGADGWRLSPAYDLTPGPSRSREERLLAMDVGALPGINRRWANRANLLSGATHFGLSREEAGLIVEEVRDQVAARWRDLVLEIGGRPLIADQIAHAFPEAYPGFEYSVAGG